MNNNMKHVRRGIRQAKKFARQEMAARMEVHTWAERWGDKWVVRRGNVFDTFILGTYATKEEAIQGLLAAKPILD